MRIAIIGAGGVGGYYGAELARAGHEVRVLARGKHLTAMRQHGLEVRTPEGSFTVRPAVSADPGELGQVDLALVAVKSYSLPEVGPAARRLAEGGAAVLPLLNGVDAAARLEEAGVPPASLLGGVTYISAARAAPGSIERRSPFRRVIVGELTGGASERAARVAEAFGSAGVEARVSEDIQVELWRKLVFLAALSAACGIARAPVGAVRDAPLGGLLLERLVREGAAVARARGVALPQDEEARALELLGTLPADMRPSFLLDLEAGGPTELDVLSGAIARLGRDEGVPTPVHDAAAAAFAAATDGL